MSYCSWAHDIRDTAWGAELLALAELSRAGMPVVHSVVVHPGWFAELLSTRVVARELSRLQKQYEPGSASVASELSEIRNIVKTVAVPRVLTKQLEQYVETFRHLQFVDEYQPVLFAVSAWMEGEWHTKKVSVTDCDDLAEALRSILLTALTPSAVAHRLDAGQGVFGQLPLVFVSLDTSTHHAIVSTNHDDGTVLTLSVDSLPLGRWDRQTALQLQSHEPGVFSLQVAHRKNRKAAALLVQDTQRRVVQLATEALQQLPAGEWSLTITAGDEPRIAWVERLGLSALDLQAPAHVLAHGVGVHPGVRSGVVRFVRTVAQKRDLHPGQVVVVPACKAADVSWMAGAAAIVTEEPIPVSGKLADALRRLSAPVVYIPLARFQLVPGQLVTVDGTRGTVLAGVKTISHAVMAKPLRSLVTATKLLTILRDPLTADAAALQGADGIGLLRGEFLLDSVGGKAHEIVKRNQVQEYGEVLQGVLSPLFRALYPNPVLYQLHDVDTEGRHHATGAHGAQQLLATPELLPTELAVLADLQASGAYHVRLLIPGVRSFEEVDAVLACIAHCWPEHVDAPEVWVRVTAPAVAMRAHELAHREIAGVLFDVPALAELLSGYDRHHPRVSHLVRHHDPALRELIFHAVDSIHQAGLPVGILSEREGLDDDVVAAAVAAGCGAVVVGAAEIHDTRQLLTQIEKRLLIEGAIAA